MTDRSLTVDGILHVLCKTGHFYLYDHAPEMVHDIVREMLLARFIRFTERHNPPIGSRCYEVI